MTDYTGKLGHLWYTMFHTLLVETKVNESRNEGNRVRNDRDEQDVRNPTGILQMQ